MVSIQKSASIKAFKSLADVSDSAVAVTSISSWPKSANGSAAFFNKDLGLALVSSSSNSSHGDDDDEEEEEDEMDIGPAEDDEAYQRIKDAYFKLQDILNKSDGDGVNVGEIREEFATLWEGVQSSHDNEIRLIQLDRQISSKLSATMAQSRYLIKLAEDDPTLAQKLAKQLEQAWEKVDAGEKDERINESRIEHLKQDIYELNRRINTAANVEGFDKVRELLGVKEDLKHQRDLAIIEANKLRTTLNGVFEKRQSVFEQRTKLLEKDGLIEKEFEAQKDAIVRETERKDRFSVEIDKAQERISVKQAEIDELEESLMNVAVKFDETERSNREQWIVNEIALREVEFSVNRIEKLKIDFENQQRLVERMTLDAYRRSQELRVKEEEVNNLKLELHRAVRQRSLNLKKVVTLQQALSTLEIERESLKTRIAILEKDLESAQKKLEGNKKRVEELDRERTFVNRNLRRAVAVNTEHTNQAKTHDVAVNTLQQAVKVYTDEISEQRHTVVRLEKERDFYSHEATKLAQKVALRLNDIKKLDIAIFQHRKKLGEIETQVKKTHQIYDIAVYDRTVFERTLRDTLAQIMLNTSKLRHLNNQVSSLRYQLNEKDESIHREAVRYQRILKETEFFSHQSQRIQREAENIQKHAQGLEAERSTLGCAVAEIEGELSKTNYYLTKVESSAEMYQRKLMEKEIKLRDIWMKWRELHSTIRIGAYHYRNLMRELRDLRFNLCLSRQNQVASVKSTINYKRLLHEFAVLNNNLSKERCMLNTLTDNIKHPMNVHRWRILEAMQPEAYELVLKINLLTKRLVDRTAQLQDIKSELDDKQCMYVEVRACVERAPGLEIPEEVDYCKTLLASKRKQFKTLQRDVEAAEQQTNYYREQVQQLHSRMLELKKQYFDKMDRRRRCCTASTISTSVVLTRPKTAVI